MLIGLGLFATRQHAACSGDVIAAGPANRGYDPVVDQDLLECQNTVLVWSLKGDPRIGIQRDEIDLLSESHKQFYQAASICRRVVDPVDQYVLKGNPAASFERKIPAGLQQC